LILLVKTGKTVEITGFYCFLQKIKTAEKWHFFKVHLNEISLKTTPVNPW